MTHSVLAPSSCARRMQCSASRRMEAMVQQTESPASMEGVLAHQVAAEWLRHERVVYHPDTGVTQEMIEGAKLWREIVMGPLNFSPAHLYIEHKIEMPSIHPDAYGTPDAFMFDYDNKKMYVFDYKFGHTEIEVFENWQLLAYACGLFYDSSEHRSIGEIELVIVQPRLYSGERVKRWSLTTAELYVYFQRLRHSERLAMTDNAPFQVGPECNYCKARAICPALKEVGKTWQEKIKTNLALELSPQDIGNELRLLEGVAKLIDARITGLQQQAIHSIQSGVAIPYYTLGYGRGSEKWKSEVSEVAALGDLMGINLRKPVDVITPKQAITAGIPEATVKQYSEHISGALRLVPDDTSKVKRAFEGVER